MNVCDSLIIGRTQHRGGGNIHTLRLHEFGYAAGRVELSCVVGHEADLFLMHNKNQKSASSVVYRKQNDAFCMV